MTLTELEEAKKTLRKTLESQKSAISISKEDLAKFVEFQLFFLKKWEPTETDKKELVDYLENYIFIQHDHDGYKAGFRGAAPSAQHILRVPHVPHIPGHIPERRCNDTAHQSTSMSPFSQIVIFAAIALFALFVAS